jgi:hypothetical protein
VSGEVLFSRNAIKTHTVGGEKCSRCGRLRGDVGGEGEGEVGAEVGDGVEDEIDVCVGMMEGVGGDCDVTGLRVAICVGDGECELG